MVCRWGYLPARKCRWVDRADWWVGGMAGMGSRRWIGVPIGVYEGGRGRTALSSELSDGDRGRSCRAGVLQVS